MLRLESFPYFNTRDDIYVLQYVYKKYKIDRFDSLPKS